MANTAPTVTEGQSVTFVHRGEVVTGTIIGVGNGSTSPTGDRLCTVRLTTDQVPVCVRESAFVEPEGTLW